MQMQRMNQPIKIFYSRKHYPDTDVSAFRRHRFRYRHRQYSAPWPQFRKQKVDLMIRNLNLQPQYYERSVYIKMSSSRSVYAHALI